MPVYDNPLYYEIAFSFVDTKKQCDLLESFIKKYSKRKVRRVLDIGCGPSMQLRELARRGYACAGLDASKEMLLYLKQKAEAESVRVETIKADMIHFRLRKKADFAFVLMGTISYVKSNEDFPSHLDSVAASLNRGGLYLIENFRLDWASDKLFRPQRWTMRKDGISVKTEYRITLKDALEQTLHEEMKLEVNDKGKIVTLKENADTKIIFPQELLELIKISGKFEFLGWFERSSLRLLRHASNNNIVLLRRKS